MFFLDPDFVETGWTLSFYAYECNSSFTLPSAGCSKEKYVFAPSSTNTRHGLAVRVWRGEGPGVQWRAVAACEAGLLLVSTTDVSLV